MSKNVGNVQFREFTEGDWHTFAGAMPGKLEQPQIGELDSNVRLDGSKAELTLVVHAVGLEALFFSGNNLISFMLVVNDNFSLCRLIAQSIDWSEITTGNLQHLGFFRGS